MVSKLFSDYQALLQATTAKEYKKASTRLQTDYQKEVKQSLKAYQAMLTGSAQAERKIMAQWSAMAGRGQAPSADSIERYALGHLDPGQAPFLASTIHLGGLGPQGAFLAGGNTALPASVEGIEAFAVSRLDPSLQADYRSTLDPFGLTRFF